MDPIERAKTLLAKAADDLDLIKDRLNDKKQRDNVGYHLAMSTEKQLKALCCISRIEYSTDSREGHRISPLFEMLSDHGVNFINDFVDLLAIEEFDSQSRYFYTSDSEHIPLEKMFNLSKDLFAAILIRMKKKGYL